MYESYSMTWKEMLIFGQKSLGVANVFYRVLSGAAKKNMALVLDIIFI